MCPSRKEALEKLTGPFDVIVIGGGITGAGIFLEATLAGLKSVLFERYDFASGTSSRSSKLVHGGLRYLREGNFKLTYEAVREREWMLKELPGLVEPLPFLFPIYKGKNPNRWMAKLGLSIYDFFAGKSYHRYLPFEELRVCAPGLAEKDLEGGYLYLDAKTDDARLVWRVIDEGIKNGGVAFNYAEVLEILRSKKGKLQGVCIRNCVNAQNSAVYAPVVINATGFLADQFKPFVPQSLHLRPLRGSHLLLPHSKLPVTQAIAVAHPQDGRMVFVIPWEGATLVGTTDLDHRQPPLKEPYCTDEEVKYLLEHLRFLFPTRDLRAKDLLSTFAGVRAIISTRKVKPSAESRDHIIIDSEGFITVTGGKLTTWRLIAKGTLKKVWPYLFGQPYSRKEPLTSYFLKEPEKEALSHSTLSTLLRKRLFGRYGKNASIILGAAADQTLIAGTNTLLAELTWIAEHEMIVHLDDLLLRRTRLGLLLPDGASALFPCLKEIAATTLNWNENKWQEEEARYVSLWRRAYQPKTCKQDS